MASLSSLRQNFTLFLTSLLALLDASLANSVIATSYAQHCSSIAAESSPTKLLFGASNSFLISEGVFSSESHFNNSLFPRSKRNISIHAANYSGTFHFKTSQVHRTRNDDILQLKGTLSLRAPHVPIRNRNKTSLWSRKFYNHSAIVFKLSGFWSEAKGKLCMIGTGQISTSALSVVLKLEYPRVSTITTSVIAGSIEGLDIDSRTYLNCISLLAYAQRRYEYTITDQAEESCSHLPREESVSWDTTSICLELENSMRYERFTSSSLVDFLGFRFLSTRQFSCIGDGMVHLSMILSNKPTSSLSRKPFSMTKLLVAEGVWDHHNSRLCLLACDLSGKENNSYSVRDCSLGLTFWFPTTFSLKQRSTVVGCIWNTSDKSSKSANTRVSLYSIYRYSNIDVPGLKYEYTELDKARKYCKVKNFNSKKRGSYPIDAKSYMDMSFQLSPHGTNGKTIWGDGTLTAIGETFLGKTSINYNYTMLTTEGTTKSESASLANHTQIVWDVAYTFSYTVWDNNVTDTVQISAEGLYNSMTGTLCLVGCRLPRFSYTLYDEILNSSARSDDKKMDCSFLIRLQLPSPNSRNKEGNGTIESTRTNSDPLYFQSFEVKLSLMDISYSIQESHRMDTEVIMVIISLTFICICSYMQLRHARENIEIQPLMSITMIVVLILGCIVSLILNIKVMFLPANKHQVFLQNGGWIDTTNAIVKLITLVALLIYFRLLQLAWGSRSKDEHTQVISWNAEKKSAMFCAFLCVIGALVAWFSHSQTNYYRTITEDLERYAGLILDNFLLPQITFNVFSQSKEKVLNPFFYVGTTMVRSMPHIYNAYRVWWHPATFYNASYIYANHSEDYYSTFFDIIVPFDGFLFMLFVFLQQWLGGRCFLPHRFTHSSIVDYDPVYVSNI